MVLVNLCSNPVLDTSDIDAEEVPDQINSAGKATIEAITLSLNRFVFVRIKTHLSFKFPGYRIPHAIRDSSI